MAAERKREQRSLTANQARVQTARLAQRIESLAEHRIGLDQAVAAISGKHLDPETWRHVFDSHDPLDIVARNGLTGCYSTFVNNYIELLKTGAYLIGIASRKRSRTKETIDAVRQDGGITVEQASHLHELFSFEGRVQHASPDIDADEVREAVELLRAAAPDLIRSALTWLESSGAYPQNS